MATDDPQLLLKWTDKTDNSLHQSKVVITEGACDRGNSCTFREIFVVPYKVEALVLKQFTFRESGAFWPLVFVSVCSVPLDFIGCLKNTINMNKSKGAGRTAKKIISWGLKP